MATCLRRHAVPALLAAVVLLVAGLSGEADAGERPLVTLIGDSIADRLESQPAALRRLNTGFSVNLETRGCRRLATPSCVIESSDDGPPPNVVQLANELGPRLGRTVVLVVGYNDDPGRIDRDFDKVMRALARQGVKRVVWLTLREARPIYVRSNRAIEAERLEWPMLTVADWDAYSAPHPSWFEADGLHLNDAGAKALATFVLAQLRRVT